MMKSSLHAAVASLLLAGATAARAQEVGASAQEPGPGTVPHLHHGPTHGDAQPGQHPRHHLMAMAAPGVGNAGRRLASAGVGYEYRFSFADDVFGIGAMAEMMAMAGHDPHPMLMAFASIHAYRGLYLQPAVGMAHVHESQAAAPGSPPRMSHRAAFRLTTGYDFHVGSTMLGPYVGAELGGSAKRAVSAGLCVGRMF